MPLLAASVKPVIAVPTVAVWSPGLVAARDAAALPVAACGTGAPVEKSVELLSVSAPAALRTYELVVVPAVAMRAVSKEVTVAP